MSVVNVLNVSLVGPNPAPLISPFAFDITFECLQTLQDDLEWKVVYVGSSESKKYDQVLTTILVGPVAVGHNKFLLETDAPDPNKIPSQEAIGVTVILLNGYYKNKEFVRVGFFVNNEYDLIYNFTPETIPKKPDFSKITREVIVTQPRVTRFPIDWTGDSQIPFLQNPGFALNDSQNSNSSSGPIPMIVEDSRSQSEFQRMDTESREHAEKIHKDFVEVLTPELARAVFQQLDVVELALCTRVSKSWKKVIDEGVKWIAIDFTDFEWEGTNSKPIEFAMNQCAHPGLQEIYLTDCPALTDELLDMWLSMSGETIKKLVVSWCSLLTPKAVEIVAQRCSVLEELRIGCIDQKEEFVYPDSVLKQLIDKFANTLMSLQISNVTDPCMEYLGSICGPRLKYVSVLWSIRVTDSGVLHMVDKSPNLEYLGVEACNVSPTLVTELRKRIKTVRSIYRPEDFTIEISTDPTTQETVIGLKPVDWKEELPIKFLKPIWSLLPSATSVKEEISDGAKQEYLAFNGVQDEAESLFAKAGFRVVNVESSSEEEAEAEEDIAEGDDLECEICDKGNNVESLIQCDECGKGYHIYCLTPPLSTMPTTSWLCKDCKSVPSSGSGPRKRQKI